MSEDMSIEVWKAEKKRKKMQFSAMQNLPYEVKVKRANIRAREFVEKLQDLGMEAHVSVGGLDSITLLVFLRHIWMYRCRRSTERSAESRMGRCTPPGLSGLDAVCVDSGSTWKNVRTDSISSASAIRRNGSSGCIGAARTRRRGRNSVGAECWITSEWSGRTIPRCK